MFIKDYEVFGFCKQNPNINPSADVVDKMTELYHSRNIIAITISKAFCRDLESTTSIKQGENLKAKRKGKGKRKSNYDVYICRVWAYADL